MPVVSPSNSFIDAVRFGAQLVQARLTIFTAGLPTSIIVPVSTVSVTVDRNAAQRRSGNLTAELIPTVPPPAILPTSPSSALAPFGNEIYIENGIFANFTVLAAGAAIGANSIVVAQVNDLQVGDTLNLAVGSPPNLSTWSGTVTSISGMTVGVTPPLTIAPPAGSTVQAGQWIPLGLFSLATTTVEDTSIDLVVNIEFYDRSWVISQRAFIQPYNFPATTEGDFGDELISLINFVWGTNQATGNPIPGAPPLTFNIQESAFMLQVPTASYGQGSDPWQAAIDMANAVGFELFFDIKGVVTAYPIPDPTTQPITWNFTDDPTAIFGGGGAESGGGSTQLFGSPYSTPVAVKNVFTRDGIFNDIYISGTGTSNAPASTTGSDAPVLAEASDTNPNSPTYVGGPMGDIPEFVSSNLTISSAQAQTTANSDLLTALSASWQITISNPPNPIFDIDDVVTVTRPRIGLNAVPMVIDSISYVVSYGDVSTITGRVVS